ncbi:MAG TPA: aldo/keto reductase [Candidatus Saccharimonadia bacterium]|nr:aldo/keto reductase [Candidatus Saccharimonadia bacterium]
MKIPTKRLANGFELPVYGLGLWQMGGRWEADRSHDEREVTAIRAALERGVTHLDTAEVYGDGHAEELLARAVEGFDRSKLTVATKVSGVHQSYDGVKRALAASLERLRMDYVDLYLLHEFPAPGLRITDTMRAMDALVDEGLVRHIGVSNFSPARLAAAQAASAHKLACNQVHYNVQIREAERRGVLAQCQSEDVMLVAYRPMEKGALAGAPALEALARKYNKTPTQIAINWLVSQDHVVTIAKTSRVDHLEENLGALDFAMEPDDVEWVRSEFPDQKGANGAVPLDHPGDVAPW